MGQINCPPPNENVGHPDYPPRHRSWVSVADLPVGNPPHRCLCGCHPGWSTLEEALARYRACSTGAPAPHLRYGRDLILLQHLRLTEYGPAARAKCRLETAPGQDSAPARFSQSSLSGHCLHLDRPDWKSGLHSRAPIPAGCCPVRFRTAAVEPGFQSSEPTPIS